MYQYTLKLISENRNFRENIRNQPNTAFHMKIDNTFRDRQNQETGVFLLNITKTD